MLQYLAKAERRRGDPEYYDARYSSMAAMMSPRNRDGTIERLRQVCQYVYVSARLLAVYRNKHDTME